MDLHVGEMDLQVGEMDLQVGEILIFKPRKRIFFGIEVGEISPS